MRTAFWTALYALLSSSAVAQSAEEHLRIADSLYADLKPAAALQHYLEAVTQRPNDYETLWKVSRSQIDVAKQLDEDDQSRRDHLYNVSKLYAEQAVRANDQGAEGHFMLAQALGRLSRTKGGKERVEFAKEIYQSAARALELDPQHDGAHHVLGAWHAEVLRLSGVARFFAKTFLGADFMERASWDSATAHLERSVELKPDYIFHRLELARVYLDLERYADARRMLESIAELPVGDVMDPKYQEEARELLEEIEGQ